MKFEKLTPRTRHQQLLRRLPCLWTGWRLSRHRLTCTDVGLHAHSFKTLAKCATQIDSKRVTLATGFLPDYLCERLFGRFTSASVADDMHKASLSNSTLCLVFFSKPDAFRD